MPNIRYAKLDSRLLYWWHFFQMEVSQCRYRRQSFHSGNKFNMNLKLRFILIIAHFFFFHFLVFLFLVSCFTSQASTSFVDHIHLLHIWYLSLAALLVTQVWCPQNWLLSRTQIIYFYPPVCMTQWVVELKLKTCMFEKITKMASSVILKIFCLALTCTSIYRCTLNFTCDYM